MSTHYVVVDGSNIATEGRSLPSLRQLDEAVRAFLTEHPADQLTVVVDATFGHRIDAVRARRLRRGRPRGRARQPAGRRHRPRRRLRPADRGQGRRRHPVQRLVPGVPRAVPVAVRRRPPDRRQAGSRARLGVRAAHTRAGPGQPTIGQGRQGRPGHDGPPRARPGPPAAGPPPPAEATKATKATKAAKSDQGRGASTKGSRTRKAADGRTAKAAEAETVRAGPAPPGPGQARRAPERPAPVRRLRLGPSGRHDGRGRGRELQLARRLRARRRGALLHPVEVDG